MGYHVTQFGAVVFPTLAEADEFGATEFDTPLVNVPNGQFDAGGTTLTRAKLETISVSRVLYGGDAASVHRSGATLRALVGTIGTLWRTWDNGTAEWCTARWLSFTPIRSDHRWDIPFLPFSANFERISEAWYSTDQATLTLTSGADYAYTHPGDAEIHSLTFTVKAVGGAVTAVVLANSTASVTLAWAGTLASGKTLSIATHAQIITNDGVDAFAALTRPTNTPYWMLLRPGSNTLRATVTGGTGANEIRLCFYPAWRTLGAGWPEGSLG